MLISPYRRKGEFDSPSRGCFASGGTWVNYRDIDYNWQYFHLTLMDEKRKSPLITELL